MHLIKNYISQKSILFLASDIEPKQYLNYSFTNVWLKAGGLLACPSDEAVLRDFVKLVNSL